MKIEPGYIVTIEGRIWRVTGCYYGALGHEDIIGLEPLDKKPGSVGEASVAEMTVPLALIPKEGVYAPALHP